jgi:predicted Ser/Thr protein kinase
VAADVATRLVGLATKFKQANDSAGQSYDTVMSQFPPKLLKEAHKKGVTVSDLGNGAKLTTKVAVGLDGSTIKYGFVTDSDNRRYTVSDGLVKEVVDVKGSEWEEAFQAAVRSKIAGTKPIAPAKVQQAVDKQPAKQPAKQTTSSSGKIAPYSTVKVLGEGVFGKAVLTDRGSVVKTLKKYKKSDAADLQLEFDGLKVLGDLGIGPKPIALDLAKGVLEMEYVEGPTLKDKHGTVTLMGDDADKVVLMMAKLHKAGYLHNDAHRGNIIITGSGDFKLIDAGFLDKASKAGGAYNHGLADLASSDISSSIKRRIHEKLNRSGASSKYTKAAAEYTYKRDRPELSPQEVSKLRDQAGRDYHNEYLKAIDELGL